MQMGAACRRYQADMAELSDATKLLYRDYAAQASSWQAKSADADKQVRACWLCGDGPGCWPKA
jgi:hypothetical protein